MYDIGDVVTVTATFLNRQGASADPTDVVCRIKDPEGLVTTVAMADLANPVVGEWEHDVAATKAGKWHYRFEGTGAVTAASEGVFAVRESAFM